MRATVQEQKDVKANRSTVTKRYKEMNLLKNVHTTEYSI